MVSCPNDIHNMQSLTEIYLGWAYRHRMLQRIHLALLHPFRKLIHKTSFFGHPLLSSQSINYLQMLQLTICNAFHFHFLLNTANHFLLTDIMLQTRSESSIFWTNRNVWPIPGHTGWWWWCWPSIVWLRWTANCLQTFQLEKTFDWPFDIRVKWFDRDVKCDELVTMVTAGLQ